MRRGGMAGRSGDGKTSLSAGPTSTFMRASRSSFWRIGFTMWAGIPRARQRAMLPKRSSEVNIMRVFSPYPGKAPSLSRSSKPSIPGIRASINSKEKRSSASFSRADLPFETRQGFIPHCPSICWRMPRLVSLSSTTSTGSPCNRESSGGRAEVGESGSSLKRAVKWKVLPFPSWLSAQILPSINSANCFEMDNPRPVPPRERRMLPSIW